MNLCLQHSHVWQCCAGSQTNIQIKPFGQLHLEQVPDGLHPLRGVDGGEFQVQGQAIPVGLVPAFCFVPDVQETTVRKRQEPQAAVVAGVGAQSLIFAPQAVAADVAREVLVEVGPVGYRRAVPPAVWQLLGHGGARVKRELHPEGRQLRDGQEVEDDSAGVIHRWEEEVGLADYVHQVPGCVAVQVNVQALEGATGSEVAD